MDARILEQHKENIQPLPNGRPALKLGLALIDAPSKASLGKKREEFEKRLSCDDSDDPLQDHIDYINWIQTNYRLGNSVESGLLNVLEQCTLCFRDTPYYKNDARYLKIWLQYAGYSELPRDIFVYLAKKGIGLQLALYYEEFAKYLELNSQLADSKEVYEVGIEREARPLARLLRSFQNFNKRVGGNNRLLSGDSNIRTLVLRQPTAASIASQPVNKKQKLSVHTDIKELGFKEIVFNQNNSPDFALILGRTRENIRPTTPWEGATIEQSNKCEAIKPPKFEVFRDSEPKEESSTGYDVIKENNEYFTMVKQEGKPTEKLCVNLDLFYLPSGEEFCLGEMFGRAAYSRRKAIHTQETHRDKVDEDKLELQRCISTSIGEKPKERSIYTSTQLDSYTEQNHTFTIPLRDEDTTRNLNSPTMTMVSRMTANEVLKMFNEAAHNNQLEDELFKTFEESTDYEGFVTETIDAGRRTSQGNSQRKRSTDAFSSPFLERPD